jgi:4-aminobutyrate aminotransferase-like enzyme
MTAIETHKPLSHARSHAAFNAEAQYLAPGTQSVALFSQLCIDHGEGACLYDVDGNRYIDLLAGVGVAALGHAHPRWVAAMQRQLSRVHVGSFTTEHRAALVEMLARVTPGDLSRTQFYSSGAEAVEAALRLAKAHTGRTEVVGFWGGFHGKTGGVLPLLSGSFKHSLGPLMPGMYSTPYATCPICPPGQHTSACSWNCVEFLARKIELETTNDVAAIIVEPIQGTAGNIIPHDGFLRELRALCDRIGALLIADEMITGFGRTGTMFGVEHDGVVPDIMLLGKGFGGGFPMSGLVARESIAFAKPWANPSGSSSSYGGNPLAAAAARTAIDIIIEDGLVANSKRVGGRLLAELQRWEREIPMVRRARGRGLMIGFDLVDPATGKLLDKAACRRIFDACLDRGVIAMIYNPEVRINPPLIIDEALALEGFAVIEEVLRDVGGA